MEIEALCCMKEAESSKQAGMGGMDGVDGWCRYPWWALQPLVPPSCFRTLVQAGRANCDNNSGSPMLHRGVLVPTVGLAASKPTLPPLAHAAGAGFFGKRAEVCLLLPRGVITVQSPWDWSDLPDSCAPEQHEHVRSLTEGRPLSPHLYRLVPCSLQPSWRLLSVPRPGGKC